MDTTPSTADRSNEISFTAADNPGKAAAPERDLPEPLRLRRVVGPSLVLLAVGIGGGEFVLWPFVSSRAGLGLLWVAFIGLATHFVVNMEIERYTLATGETVITGFSRMWRPWSWVFIVFTALIWVWPGWVAGASTIAGFAFGWQRDTVVTVSVLGLIAIGISLSVSPMVYRIVERVQWVLILWMLAFVLAGVVVATDVETWGSVATDFRLQLPPDLSPTMILGLLVFAGAGGTLNLALSNWIRDKDMGMGVHLRPIASPFTAHPSDTIPMGRPFQESDENLRRWRGWWKVANIEHLIFFLLAGLVIIAGLSALSTATVFGLDLGEGLDFIRSEGQILGERVGLWFPNLFWISGAVILYSTNLGIVDHLGRLIADILKVNWLAEREFWSESKLYVVVVWIEIILSSVILLSGMDAPLALLVLAGSVGGFVMFVYSLLLVRLNRTALPQAARLRGWRLWGMVWAVVLFGSFSFFVIWTGVLPTVARIGGVG